MQVSNIAAFKDLSRLARRAPRKRDGGHRAIGRYGAHPTKCRDRGADHVVALLTGSKDMDFVSTSGKDFRESANLGLNATRRPEFIGATNPDLQDDSIWGVGLLPGLRTASPDAWASKAG